jgi:imidazolonepropionase-like amidohydrolase
MTRPQKPASRQLGGFRRILVWCVQVSAGGLIGLFWLHADRSRGEDDPARPRNGYPLAYAIKEAKVVVAPGKILDPGTVVIRRGLIEAVGPSKDLVAPFDAEVIEGKGLVVYPGFIDLYTTVGQRPGVERSVTGRGRGVDLAESPLAVTPADNRKGLTPEFEVSGALELSDALAEPRRRLGFTDLVSAPAGAIATGQSALVSLSGLPRREAIVKAPVALHIHLAAPTEPAATPPGRPDSPPQQGPPRRRPALEQGPAENPYPRVLMGAVAHLRQAMLDAEYHQTLLDLDQGGSDSRAPYDPALRTLEQARKGKLPVWWEADTRDEIHRALDLAAEFGTTAVIVGGRESALVLDRLKAEHVAVILRLSFPEEPSVPSDEDYRKRPLIEQEEPLRLLVRRKEKWKEHVAAAAALARAGIPFAIATDGLDRLDNFPARLRAIISAGLTPDLALAALTSGAARIVGLDRRLGTIEAGKLGHLVAFSAPFQDERARAKVVLVDGLKFEVKAPEPDAGAGRPDSRRGSPGRGEARANPPSPGSSAATGNMPGATLHRSAEPGERPKEDKKSAQAPHPKAAGSAPLSKRQEGAKPAKTDQAKAEKPKASPAPPPSAPQAKPDSKPSPKPEAKPSPKPETKPPAPASVDVATEFEPDRAAKQKTGGNVLIKDATILTVTRGTIARGSILAEKGIIKAVGPDLKAGPGVTVIEAAGLVALPGIIDTHSHIAIEGGVNEFSLSIVPEVRVKDVVTGDDVAIYRALAGGTTSARLLHGSANTIGGQDTVIKLRYGKPGRDLIIQGAPQGVKFALGENVTRLRGRFPNTRMGVESVIERAFEEARAYQAQWRAFEDARKKDKGKCGPPPRRDLRLEALARILDGSIKIHSHCYRSDEILMLLGTAERYGVRVKSLQHVLEGYKVAAEIADHGASASTFSDWWAYKVEAYDAIPFNAALLTEAGVSVCIKSDSDELIRHLNLEAAKMVKYGGLTEAQALAMITINPARELGLEKRLGSIDVGKDADIALYSAHPFDAFSRCELALIDGEVYFSRREPDGKFFVRPGDHQKMPQADLAARSRAIEFTAQRKGVFALVGATLHPVSGPTIPGGTLIVEGGKIAAIGPAGLPVPPEAQTIELSGLDIWPGMIDAGSTIGLSEIGSLTETQDFADASRFQPELLASTALRPDSEHIPVTRANGVLTALVQPTGGLISGQGCVVNFRGWVPREMVLVDAAALNVTIPAFVPRNPDRPRRAPGPGPAPGGTEGGPDPQVRRKEQLEAIRDQFRRAMRSGEVVASARARGVSPPPFDPRLSALYPYAKGQKPVIFHANHRTEILDALAIAKDLKLKAVISGASEGWKVAGALKDAGVPVLVAGTLNVPAHEHDPYDAAYANPARLHAAGVTIAIRSKSGGPAAATGGRNVPYEAATAAAFGLPEDVALKAVTLTPAQILGVADRLGSLQAGKRANLVVTAGHILQPTTPVLALFIDGRHVTPESRHTQLYAKYLRRLQEVRAGTAPLGLERPGTTAARVPACTAAAPAAQ